MQRPPVTTLILLTTLAVGALAPRVRAEDPPVQFGAEASVGIAGLALTDFKKAAGDRGGSADLTGWTAGGRAIIFLPIGLGMSAGVVEEGGGSYDATVTAFNKKKATSLTITTSARFSERSFPVSLHYRTNLGRLNFGAEGGVDFTTATIAYAESDSNGGVINGDLTKGGTGFHVAAEGTLKLTDALWAFVRAGYVAVSLKEFSGMVNDNGTMKQERLFMVKNSTNTVEDLEVSTSTSATSADHRLAEVSGTGFRVSVGLRILFP